MEHLFEQLDNQTKTLLDGWKRKDGKMTTQSKDSSLDNQANNLASTSEPESHSESIKNNKNSQKQLMSLLLICFDTLDTFGKEPEQLKNLKEAFQMVLGRFTIEKVKAAFRIYMETQSVMPKPSDIVKIIEPPVEPRKWCKITFLEIKRKRRENVFTTNEENQYCEDFVSAQVNASEEQKNLMEDTMRQLAIEDRRYWSDL